MVGPPSEQPSSTLGPSRPAPLPTLYFFLIHDGLQCNENRKRLPYFSQFSAV
jgi:hypothetical protein